MSGTSMDGIDAALVEFGGKTLKLHALVHQPFPPQLRDTLLALNQAGDNELHRAAQAANALSLGYAAIVQTLLAQTGTDAKNIAAIGCHGQTVRHQPQLGYTTQLVNGALLAELGGITVVCDFRSRDIAAGGEGAPLVPAFHQAVFASPQVSRAVINIGGIANISYLPVIGEVSGFDCGPGNALMDGWIAAHLGTSMHLCATVPMGPASDPDAAVDQFGRCHGIEGLRVVDLSILPSAPTRGPACTAVTLGEHLAGTFD